MYFLQYTASTTKGILKFSAWLPQEYVSPTKKPAELEGILHLGLAGKLEFVSPSSLGLLS